MLRRTFILLAALALILGQDIQAPLLVSTTSCRSWPATALPPPTQALSRASTTTPALVSSCVLATRPARVSLRAEAGVFAHVYDAWGTCNQYIEFNFNQDWSDYRFGMAYYDDPGQGCNGVPTATMSCGLGISTQLTKDETFKLSPTPPYAARMNATETGAGWIYCNPA